MCKNIFYVFFFILFVLNIQAQVVSVGCFNQNDATIGLDRKNWNNGSTAIHSEGYLLNFTLPDDIYGDCKKISNIEFDLTVNSIDISGMPPGCVIGAYYINVYQSCPGFGGASCPLPNLIDEFPNGFLSSQTFGYNCPPFEFDFNEVIGIDIIPVVNVPDAACVGAQTLVTDGLIQIDFSVCLEATIVDDVIDVPVNLGSDFDICPNTTTSIDAGSGYAMYDWLPNGQMSQMITEGPGTYSVTVTDANGCTDEDDITIDPLFLDLTVMSSDADNIVCSPDMVTLTASSSGTNPIFSWSNGMFGPSITVGAGMYTVTVTDAALCMLNSDANPITVVVNTPPEAGADNTLQVCNDNQSYDLEALLSGADSGGSWMDLNGAGVSLANPQNVNFLNVPIGDYDFSYTVMGSDPCPDDVAVITVTVQSAGNAGTNNVLTACNNGQVYDLLALLGTADSGGIWSDANGAGVNLSNPSSVSFLGVSSGVYGFTYTINGLPPCNDAMATITVTVEEMTNAGTNNTLQVCNDNQSYDLFFLLGGADTGGSWTDLNGSGVNLSNPSNVSFLNAAPGSYDFEYSVNGVFPCNDASAILTVDVAQNANAGNDNSLTVCGDGQLYDLFSLLGGADAGGVWADINGSGVNLSDPQNVSFLNLSAATYNFSYTVTGLFACMDQTATIAVTVGSSANAGTDNSIDVCSNGAVFNIEQLLGMHDSGGFWTDIDGSNIDLNTNAVAVDFSGVMDGTYSFTYTASIPMCSDDIATIIVNVSSEPFAGTSAQETICSSGNTVLDLFSMLNGAESGGTWNDVNMCGVDLSDPSSVDFQNVGVGTCVFEYTLLGVAPCSDNISTVTVNIEQGVSAGMDNTISVCEGQDYDLNDALLGNPTTGGTFDDTSGSGALVGSIFSTTGLNNQSFTFTYMVGTMGDCGSDQAIITVNVVEELSAGVDSINNELCIGETIDLYDYLPLADQGGVFNDVANGNALANSEVETAGLTPGVYSYEYEIGDGLVCPLEMSIIEIEFFNAPSVVLPEDLFYCEGGCQELIFEFNGNAPFTYSLALNDVNGFVQNIELSSLESLDTLVVCASDAGFSINNDTLNIANQAAEWVLVPLSFEDSRCTIDFDPLDSIFVEVGSAFEANISPTLCPGESIEVNNVVYDQTNASGQETILTPGQCDSIYTIQLSFYLEANNLIDDSLCEGQSIEIDGQIFDELNPTGQVVLANASFNGCDSIIDVDLEFVEGFDIQLQVELCEGDSIFVANAWQFTAGDYVDQFVSTAGCDSVVTTMVTLETCDIPIEVQLSNNDCFEGEDGVIAVSIGAGDFPYTVNWDNGTQMGSFTVMQSGVFENVGNLVSGNYTLEIFDSNNVLIDSRVVVIMDLNSQITVALDEENVSCFGLNDGTIQVNADGGTGNYAYTWGHTNDDVDFVNQLGPQMYNVIVTDDLNCSASAVAQIIEPSLLGFTFTTEDIPCSNPNGGEIEILNISGGVMPYAVFVDNQEVFAPYVIDNLGVGNYLVEVFDSNQCMAMETVVLIGEGDVSFEVASSPVNCGMLDDGVIEVSNISGGNGPYTVLVDNIDFGNQLIINNQTQGTHQVVVRDADGCSSSMQIVVDKIEDITYVVLTEDVSCGELSDGIIDVEDIAGGVAPYTVSIGGIIVSPLTGLANLEEGEYEIVVSDSDGCSSTQSVTLGKESDITFEVDFMESTCPGIDDGFISVTNIMGGSGNYLWLLNGISQDQTFESNGLVSGDYDIEVLDDQNCSMVQTITLNAAAEVDLGDYQLEYMIMQGESIELQGTITNDVMSIVWENDPTLSCSDCSNPMATPLSNQTYLVTLFDDNGCSESFTITVEVEQLPEADDSMYIPNAFSPNKDGSNDFYQIFISSDAQIEVEEFQIFDRWGEVIYSENPIAGISDGWDGRFKGEEVTAGIYVYYLVYRDSTDERIFKTGDITLIR